MSTVFPPSWNHFSPARLSGQLPVEKHQLIVSHSAVQSMEAGNCVHRSASSFQSELPRLWFHEPCRWSHSLLIRAVSVDRRALKTGCEWKHLYWNDLCYKFKIQSIKMTKEQTEHTKLFFLFWYLNFPKTLGLDACARPLPWPCHFCGHDCISLPSRLCCTLSTQPLSDPHLWNVPLFLTLHV